MLQSLLMHYSEILPNGELRSATIIVELVSNRLQPLTQPAWSGEVVSEILARANSCTNVEQARTVVDKVFYQIIYSRSMNEAAKYMPQVISCIQKYLPSSIYNFNSSLATLLGNGVKILIEHSYAVNADLMPQINQIIRQFSMGYRSNNHHRAWVLLDTFVQEWEPESSGQLIQNLMRVHLGNIDHNRHSDIFILSLLTRFKQQLINANLDLYQGMARYLLSRLGSHCNDEILTVHSEFISNEELQAVYIGNDSPTLRYIIRRYLQGPGAVRNLVLPQVVEIIDEDEQPVIHHRIDGIAFDVHNYMVGLEGEVINLLGSLLTELKIRPLKSFKLNEISKKFSILESEDERKAAKSALNQLKHSEHRATVESAMKLIGSFLNNDELFKDSEHKTEDGRWRLWLQQSFVEAGNAYDVPNGVSCPKGVFERVFSGLRILHPVVNAIFLRSEIIKNYQVGINIKAAQKEVITGVVNELRKDGVRKKDQDFADKWKQAFLNQFKLRFKAELTSEDDKILALLQNTPQTQGKIKKMLDKPLPEFNAVLPKIKDAVDNLIWVESTIDDIQVNLIDYIANCIEA